MRRAFLAFFVCIIALFPIFVHADIVIEAEKSDELTTEEKTAIYRQKLVLDEIMHLYAERSLDRPKDFAACVREMFAMRHSDKCRDKFTHYYSPEDAKKNEEDLSGKFGGIGIEMTQEEDNVVVITAISETPAERAGIMSGDIVVRVDDKRVDSIDGALRLIRGKPGTQVSVTIFRKKMRKEMTFKITREIIVVRSVKWRLSQADPKIGIIEISGFDNTAGEKFAEALIDLVKKGVHGVLIDLRNNPGGYVDSALDILSHFALSHDTILTVRYRRKVTVYKLSDLAKSVMLRNLKVALSFIGTGKSIRDLGVVVLINNGSASASEIVSGTLQDWGYPIIGEKSFGKGVGQNIFTLSDNSRLNLTVFEFLVGNNRGVIRDKGVKPTIEVKAPERKPGEAKLDEKGDLQLMKAIEVLQSCVKKDASHKCTR